MQSRLPFLKVLHLFPSSIIIIKRLLTVSTKSKTFPAPLLYFDLDVTLALLSISYLHFARSPASILLIIVFYARIPKSASQPRHHRSIIFSQLDFRSKMDKKEDQVFFLQGLKQRGQNENSAACQIIKKKQYFSQK